MRMTSTITSEAKRQVKHRLQDAEEVAVMHSESMIVQGDIYRTAIQTSSSRRAKLIKLEFVPVTLSLRQNERKEVVNDPMAKPNFHHGQNLPLTRLQSRTLVQIKPSPIQSDRSSSLTI
jgi:hypothetical protein